MEINIKNLSIEEKIGQMIIVGLDTKEPYARLEELVVKHKVGGILLYKKNYKTYEEMVKLINHIKKLNSNNKVPILICIDQEGGRVNRMPKEFLNIPPANTLSNYKNEDLVKKSGEIMSEMLSSVGINLNFAPVLDIKRFSNNHAIGDRAFSDDIEQIKKYSTIIIEELQDKNIIPVIKHFPGHGLTVSDTHFKIPIVKKEIEEIENTDMQPFEEAIKKGADAVLISHMKIKKADSKNPVSISRRFICKYLRKKYRYNGVILTDDMRMRSMRLKYGEYIAIQKAFQAGNDIIVFKNILNDKIYEKLLKDIKLQKIKESRINKSVNRVLKMKEKYKINDKEIDIDNNLIDRINNQIKNLPF